MMSCIAERIIPNKTNTVFMAHDVRKIPSIDPCSVNL